MHVKNGGYMKIQAITNLNLKSNNCDKGKNKPNLSKNYSSITNLPNYEYTQTLLPLKVLSFKAKISFQNQLKK